MSYCRKEGKDRVIFMSKEDYEKPSTVVLPSLSGEREPGPILPNGDINWACPCMSNTISGPCGFEFREAFSCFHYSKTEPKGEDCIQPMRTWHECLTKHET